jgi:hypothetical protein
MPDAQFDFAILGSSPLALLLAGLLAQSHKKRVCLVSEAPSEFRLPRGFDLSVAPVTRRETWALLGRTVPEVRKLLASINARRSIERIDPVFSAETPGGAEALHHTRQMMSAYGHAVERFGKSADSFRVRDALLLHRTDLEVAVGPWLDAAGVQRFPAENAAVALHDGGATIAPVTGDAVDAAVAIAADDNAILAYAEPGERSRLVTAETVTSVLTEQVKPLASRLSLIVDRAEVLLQQRGGTVLAQAPGDGGTALPRIGARLADQGRVRRAGQASFAIVRPLDGAPLIGQAKGLKAAIVAGLGLTAPFLAPALARYFAGVAPDDETRYFAAREAGTAASRADVADFAGGQALGSAW